MILYMYITSGQGQIIPWGQNVDVNRNILSLQSFVTSFKTISLKSDFIKKKNDFIQGKTTAWGRNFDVNRNILSLRSFITSFKNNLF